MSVEPISPTEAQRILYEAIRQKLGPKWDDEETGWAIISEHHYMARLTKGRQNIDFYVDLLGQVTIEEKEISPAQDSGRVFAFLFLIGAIFVALLISWLTGLR
ncbi:MAG: hypothetical protein MUF87_14820 [Anaerolineae bacterium]|jgi:hypothetical protein|nr:hypothetical protein [Anaerolineae bacterium]